MTIAPIVRTVDVKCGRDRAFDLFTRNMAAWWPANQHIGATPFEAVVVEAAAGGRWYERGADGAETQWGKVIDWAPPGRLLLAWQLGADFRFDPDFHTEIEITFTASGGGTRVRLEHRNLERFGAAAETMAKSLNGGWALIVGAYAGLADRPIEEEV